jgi:Asp-tRNA(Asn)/Glu-tRNA(Gln) amidotransferase C subunit
MSLSSRKILTALVVAGLGIAGTAAIAQQAAAPAAPGPEKHGEWGEHHHMLPSQMVEARLAFIKTALQITPAQTTQWNAFADFMRKRAKARDEKVKEMQAKFEAMKNGDHKRPDPVEMLEHRQKMLTEASANLAEFITVVKPLYASLSDSQKEVADDVLAQRMHRGMGEHHWEGR